MKNKKVVCIVGPTSSGKTALSIALAKAYDGEIISADSRQVYQGLDLGSGKVTKEEMAGIPHYLLDVADPKETFTASEFARLGKRALNEIFDKEKLPIVTGGTGFYIDVLLGIITPAEVPPNETLRRELETKTITELQQLLQEKDPERFETIDTHNPRRLIRALEIAEELGKNPEPKSESPYTILWIGLTVPSEELHKKIHMRIMHRFEQGMLEEAQRLHEEGLSYERMEELGLEYRYMARHLQGTLTYEEMIAELETATVQYAKRQMTWFKKNSAIQWFAPDETEKVMLLVANFIK